MIEPTVGLWRNEERIIPRDLYQSYVGSEIRKARTERGWTQLRLALELGVESGACVSYWEAGRTSPSSWMLARLEALFGRRLRP